MILFTLLNVQWLNGIGNIPLITCITGILCSSLKQEVDISLNLVNVAKPLDRIQPLRFEMTMKV
ncbi:hypothetical protein NQ318_021181 [Aromia moschata]|uniref:Uncharacterized protein n=1 Tax=Aromia moschata TaxID=1265417 RepID=A0AAV8YG95_9CUCU|nr:hypothetical protein NQ318_021181 [Aromia moschata]